MKLCDDEIRTKEVDDLHGYFYLRFRGEARASRVRSVSTRFYEPVVPVLAAIYD